MKIYNSFEEFRPVKNPIVTSGTFDGVHVAHQKILKHLRESAKVNDGEVVLLTFWPHPRIILYPDTPLLLINSFEEKAKLLEKFGVNHLIKIPFTREFSQLGSDEFINKILINTLQTKRLVIGFNHRFGKNREGSFDYLKANEDNFPFSIEEIPRQEIENMAISSTQIRRCLSLGQIKKANQYMGHFFTLSGTVIHGDKIGKSIGFPTANIFVNSLNKMIPSDGVYAVKCHIREQVNNGMLYIGQRPTVNGNTRNIEVNIFDFEEDVYGESISVEFIEEVRGDQKFSNLDELKQQLVRDKESSLKILDTHEEKS